MTRLTHWTAFTEPKGVSPMTFAAHLIFDHGVTRQALDDDHNWIMMHMHLHGHVVEYDAGDAAGG